MLKESHSLLSKTPEIITENNSMGHETKKLLREVSLRTFDLLELLACVSLIYMNDILLLSAAFITTFTYGSATFGVEVK